MKVECENRECSQFEEVVETKDWDGRDSYGLYLLRQCPVCHKKRKLVELESVPSETPIGFEKVSFGKISSMSMQDRKKILKKRSNEHFNKNIKERKEYLDRSFLGKE